MRQKRTDLRGLEDLEGLMRQEPTVKTILFVCTANICRSPMAAGLMRKRIADLGLADQVSVQSAGVWAREGLEASENAAAVLAARDISLAEHRSRPVDISLLQQADLVLVMKEAHRRSLFYLAPQHLGKVYLLTEMSGRHEDVDDPYGGEVGEYVATVKQLEELIAAGLPHILARLGIAADVTRCAVNTSGT
jgi:protein-tyrosine-phosphatase